MLSPVSVAVFSCRVVFLSACSYRLVLIGLFVLIGFSSRQTTRRSKGTHVAHRDRYTRSLRGTRSFHNSSGALVASPKIPLIFSRRGTML